MSWHVLRLWLPGNSLSWFCKGRLPPYHGRTQLLLRNVWIKHFPGRIYSSTGYVICDSIPILRHDLCQSTQAIRADTFHGLLVKSSTDQKENPQRKTLPIKGTNWSPARSLRAEISSSTCVLCSFTMSPFLLPKFQAPPRAGCVGCYVMWLILGHGRLVLNLQGSETTSEELSSLELSVTSNAITVTPKAGLTS